MRTIRRKVMTVAAVAALSLGPWLAPAHADGVIICWIWTAELGPANGVTVRVDPDWTPVGWQIGDPLPGDVTPGALDAPTPPTAGQQPPVPNATFMVCDIGGTLYWIDE
ncbi:MAG: hypothetical protein ACLGH3_01915 [Actinomycetota bacterium]